MKNIFIAVITTVLSSIAAAETWIHPITGVEWSYEVIGGCASVGIGGEDYMVEMAVPADTMGKITVPSEIDGYVVNRIGYMAFARCSGLTSVTIPSSVKIIGGYAFSGCTGLKSLVIPSGVTDVGEGAFRGCSGLTSVSLPSSLSSLGDSLFSGCSGLKNVSIPFGISRIGNAAFSGCSGLTSVSIPANVTSIGDYAFSLCSGLASVRIPSSVTSVGSNPFAGCGGISSFRIDSENPSYKYANGYLLTKDGKTLVACIKGNGVMPEGVTQIGVHAFHSCSGLTAVTFPSSVTSIGDYAFIGCGALTSITIPSSVSDLERYWDIIAPDFSREKTTSSGTYFVLNSDDWDDDCPESVVYYIRLDGEIGQQAKVQLLPYAYEPPVYTVTFDANGGLCAFDEDWNAVQYESFQDGADVWFPAVARDGYHIDGWFTEKDGGTSIEEGFRISSNMRLYAHWHSATFAMICFDACGGSCDEDERQVDTENALSGLPVPTRSGYWFVGWYTDENAGTIVAQGDVISSDMVLYAHWLKLNSPYLVVNLSEDEGTPQYQVSELDECPDDGWSDEYKTTSLVLRLIEGGITNQNGRAAAVTNTFYAGIFEVTQRQWELVMGTRPSYFSNDEYYASRPVEQISKADAEAFINVLQERTGLNFSLPTESQ